MEKTQALLSKRDTNREKQVWHSVPVAMMTLSRRNEGTERRLEHDDTDVNERKTNTAKNRY